MSGGGAAGSCVNGSGFWGEGWAGLEGEGKETADGWVEEGAHSYGLVRGGGWLVG